MADPARVDLPQLLRERCTRTTRACRSDHRIFYHVVAQQTGTLDFQVYFQLFSPSLLPGGGDLSIQVYNAAGQLLGASSGAFGAASTLASPAPTGDRVRIPAVAGQSYYLRVTGAFNVDGHINPTIVNGYNATIINTPPPVPYNLELSRSVAAGVAGSPDTGDLPTNAPPDDTGRSQFDNVTNINVRSLQIYLRLADGILHETILLRCNGGTMCVQPTAGSASIASDSDQ